MTLSEEDQKIIDELMEDPRIEKGFPERKKEMPNTNGEAPMSVTIRGYYKGYSVLLTKRDPSVSAEPLLKSAMSAIDWMEKEKDWKPVWDKDQSFTGNRAKQEDCKHERVTEAVSRSEKNPGRRYKKCLDCGKFLGWVKEDETINF